MTQRRTQARKAPLAVRTRERIAGTVFRVATRTIGLRPEMIPTHMRQQLRLIGIGDAELARVVRNLRSLTDWPYAWEAEGDRHVAAGDWTSAAATYYLAQRVLITDTPLKRRLYRLAVDAHDRVDHEHPIEHLRIPTSYGETIAGYLQLPLGATTPAPLVVIVPGVTATKEEFHVFAVPLLKRGYAVARIDSPGYGETTGTFDYDARHNPVRVVEALARDDRIDIDSIHLFGMSLGAHWALHSAVEARVKSVIAVAAPLELHTIINHVPPSYVTAIEHMLGDIEYDAMMELGERLSLRHNAADITVPVRVFHGARDRTIPIDHAHELVGLLGGPKALTVYERGHHNCLEHFDDLLVAMLEWLDDPTPALQQHQRDHIADLFDAAPESDMPPGDVISETA